jgi:hypothetical protein
LPFATSLATRAKTDRQRRALMIFTIFLVQTPSGAGRTTGAPRDRGRQVGAGLRGLAEGVRVTKALLACLHPAAINLAAGG